MTTTILTGATRGLGLAMAHQLAKQGGHLVTISRREVPDLAATAKAHGTKLTELQAELSDHADLKRIAAAMVEALEGAEHVRIIHNAGGVSPILPASKLTELEPISVAFEANIVAPIYLTGCFLNATQKATDRRIMLISSGAGRKGTHSWGVYCATKAAMDRYAEVVGLEAPTNTRVASVAPGVIDTPMQETIRGTPQDLFPVRERFENMHRDGVLAKPEQTAHRLLDLLGRDDFGQTLIDDVRNHTF